MPTPDISPGDFTVLKNRANQVLLAIEALLAERGGSDAAKPDDTLTTLHSILYTLEGSKEAPGLVSRVNHLEQIADKQKLELDSLHRNVGEVKLDIQSLRTETVKLNNMYNGLSVRLDALKRELEKDLLYHPAKHNME